MLADSSVLLEGVKVLDLTEDRGLYAGKMLADFGADVIKIEKPEGGKARRNEPFKDDIPGLEASLYFINFNTNKRGITLNLESPTGIEIFRRLAAQTDVMIEDFEVGEMESLGLDYPKLKELNRGLIMASITGFGQTGPYSSFNAPDIVSFAMGGLMYVNGPKGAAPVVAPCEQSHFSASIASVFGILTALFARMNSGEGQLVDVSAQDVIAILSGVMMQYSNSSIIAQRAGSQFGAVPGRIYPCKDGHVHILTIRPNHWKGLLEVMGRPETLMGAEWLSGAYRNANADILDAYVTEFTMTLPKMEIADLCQEQGIPCTPVNTVADFSRDPHIAEREFFIEMEHPVIGKYHYLNPPYRLSETPCRVVRPAPLLGQHNEEVYCEGLGYSGTELENFKTEGTI